MFAMMALIDSATDREKFDYLYHTYARMMLYIARQIVGSQDLAEDAVQEAYLALASHISQVEDAHSSSAKYFLTTITKHKALDILRRQADTTDIEDEVIEQMPGAGGEPLSAYLEQEQQELLVKCLKQLDSDSRTILEYKYLHALKEREIADLLGISAKAASVRLVRARNKLAKILKKEGIGNDR